MDVRRVAETAPDAVVEAAHFKTDSAHPVIEGPDALAAYDAALAEGRRQSRYLAAHVRPTLPERATHPERWTLLALVAIFAGLAWTILTLAAYALRDRR